MCLLEGDRAAHVVTWRALDPGYTGDGPCGLLTLLDEPAQGAEWTDPRALFAGRSKDGRQGHIAYFNAAVKPARPDWSARAATSQILPFAAQTTVTPDDVVALWTGEGSLDESEARRHGDEVLLVAVGADGRVIGVSTAYPQRNEQLGLDLWYARIYVSTAHRTSNIATALAVGARDHLQADFVSGRDTRGAGLAMGVQNEILKQTQSAPV